MKKHYIAIYNKETKNFIGYILNTKLEYSRCAKVAFDAATSDSIIKALLPYYIVDVF